MIPEHSGWTVKNVYESTHVFSVDFGLYNLTHFQPIINIKTVTVITIKIHHLFPLFSFEVIPNLLMYQ